MLFNIDVKEIYKKLYKKLITQSEIAKYKINFTPKLKCSNHGRVS